MKPKINKLDARYDDNDENKNIVRHENNSKNYKMNDEINKTLKESIENAYNLSVDMKEKLYRLIKKYKNIFSDKPGCINNYEHEIRLKNKKIIIRKNYPVPVGKRVKVREVLDKLEKMGIIEQAVSEYCNPLRIVDKKDGEIRICVDARYLNEHIEAEHEGPPDINDILQKYEGMTVFSTTDLTQGFLQIPLKKESRKYTAFIFDGRAYQFCRIPFGIKTVSNRFVRALNGIFKGECEEFCTIYIDDMLITSRTFFEHLEHLEKIFYRIQKAGLTINFKKSFWCRNEVKFLGFILTPESIKPVPQRLKTIMEIPPPKNRAELQGLMGMCGYYSRFVKRHANFIDPFRELLSAKNKFKWEKRHDVYLQELKNNFVQAVSLAHYMQNRPFCMQIDASKKGIRAILFQTDAEGHERIVGIVSRYLTTHETNYTITELELLAIIYGQIKFQKYLLGNNFKIYTDHLALTFLLKTQFYNSRLMR